MIPSPNDDSPYTDIDDEQEFREQVAQLVVRADAAGINVQGAWECTSNTDDSREFEVLITEVRR